MLVVKLALSSAEQRVGSIVVYLKPFVRVRINGWFGSPDPGVEQWSTGVHFEAISAPSETDILNLITAMAPHVNTFHSECYASTLSNVKELTGAYIGVDGKYVGGADQETVKYPVVGFQGVGTALHSLASACVVSLRSEATRGRASHGRMYWPALAMGLSTASMINNNASNMATAAAAMLNGFNNASATIGSIGSLVLVSGLGSGSQRYVQNVKVGRKMDHMESRERKILEDWQTVILTTAPASVRDRTRPIG